MEEFIMSEKSMPAVTVSDFSEIIKMQLEENNYRPIFGLGKGGIGKTESIHDLAIELGIGYVDIRLLLYTETDLKGIPYPNENHTKTIWLENDILPTAEKDGERGILVFDEITSAQRSVRTAAYQLLNERRLGSYVLPDGWLIVCLGNGEEDGGDYQGMEGNFANRCSVFNVIPDVEAWKSWAYAHNIDPIITAYINFKPMNLHSYNSEDETDILFASPRSWKAVSDILKVRKIDTENRILCDRIVANLGQQVGLDFLAFCKYKDETIDPMRIIMNGETPNITSNELMNITVQSVIKIIADKIKLDISAGGNITSETVQCVINALHWILTLKTEFAVMGIRDLVSTNRLVMTKIIANPQVVALIPELVKFMSVNKVIYD